MTKQLNLLDVKPTVPSLRTRLSDFKKEHRIQTYRSDMRRQDEPWIALVPFHDDWDKDIGTIMAESCRIYEESGNVSTGIGELTAVRKLCQQLHIPCDL